MSIVRPFIAIPSTLSEWDRFFRDATVGDNEITNRKLRDSSGVSVIGRSAITSGDPGDIQANNNNEFLVRRSDVLGFDTLVDADIPSEIRRVYLVNNITASQSVEANTINLVDTTSGVISVTLPTPSEGAIIHVKKVSGVNYLTIIGTIDGQANINLYLPYQSVMLAGSATAWNII